MHRTESSWLEHCPAVRTVGPAALDVVLRAGRRDGGELGVDAFDRRAVSPHAVLWQPADGVRAVGQSQTGAAADAGDGHRGDLSPPTHNAAGSWAQDLPLFAAGCDDPAARPSVVKRHHVRAIASRLFVSGGGDGLVQSARVGLAVIQHAGGKFLCRSPRRSVELWAARDLQHRPRFAIHRGGVHCPLANTRRGHQHGRSRPGVGQRVHRTAVAKREVRGGVPEGLRRRLGGGSIVGRILSLLLPPTSSSVARLPNAGHRVSGRRFDPVRRPPRKTTRNRRALGGYRTLTQNHNQPLRPRETCGGSHGPLSTTNKLLNNPIGCPNNGVHFRRHP